MTVDTYLGSVMSNALCAVMFGIFKCTNFAEVLYSISQLVRLHVGPFIQFKLFFVKTGQPAGAEGEALRQDQAEDSVLGGGGDIPPGPSHGGHRLHV